MRVDVAPLPPAAPPSAQTCLVVDVLRATSVMAVLFGRGLAALYPAATVESGRELRARLAGASNVDDGAVLLCGEVDSFPPPGFDFGNSPGEFARLPALPARRAVVATTNGTPALHACARAPLTLAAAPLNAAAATALALRDGRDVLVVCAGTRGEPSDDDLLAAGLLADRLALAGAEPTAEAARAIARYRAASDDLAAALRATRHGRRLVAQGFGDDVAFCAQADRYDRAGVLGFEDGVAVLRPAPAEGE
jgi:2-phosphosulfolactate phosphatase